MVMNKTVFLLLVIILLTSGCVYSNNTTDIDTSVFDIVVNNTNLAPTIEPSVPGTGERVAGTIYYANSSPIELMVLAHASAVGDTATVEVFINGTMVQNQSGRPLGGAESTYRSVTVIVPKFANYTVHFHNMHHYEWREYPILSGRNGTIIENINNFSSIFVNTIYTSDGGYINIKPYHPGEFGYFVNLDPNTGLTVVKHQIGIDSLIFSANGSVDVYRPLNMNGNNITNVNNVSTLSGDGLILKSPDGTKCGILTWTNANTFASTAITCP